MLQVDLRELSSGPVDTHAELAADDPLLEPLEVALAAPVRLLGRLHAAGEGRFYWRGSLRTPVAWGCSRCPAPGAVAGAAARPCLSRPGPGGWEDRGFSPPVGAAAA